MRYTLPLLLLLSFITNVLTPHNATAQKQNAITVPIAPGYDSVTKVHRFLFGESYRKLWAAPVKVRTIDLKTEKGGMTIFEKGGGLQTKSLKLKDSSGKEWVLRSIQKYPERALPTVLKPTIAKDILQDQVATGHPFAALTVPPFAKALDIPHSNPEIVYVADDPLLGEYRPDFANSVLLLEDKDPANENNSDNTEKVEKKLLEDNNVAIDQRMVLRARLLDLFLGDWDRHEGQWRWQETKTDSLTVYIPIPRDRDKVYYNTSGIFPWILSHQGLKSNLQGFHNSIRDIAGYNFNNRYFDRIFLTQLSEDEWKEQVTYVQKTLTDSLIESAVRLLPDTIYALSGKKIIETLIARRSDLMKESLKYYRFISKRVDVSASEKPEFFQINDKDNGDVEVNIYKIKDEAATSLIYHRDFDHHYTKEVRLYGIGGKDIFSVTGTQKLRIKVRMISGNDVDSFHVDENLKNKRKLYIYEPTGQENKLLPGYLARIKTSNDSLVSKYDPHNFKYDKFGPLVTLLYTKDQQAMIRAGVSYEKHGFRKEPFAEKHMLSVNYANFRHSFMLEYSAYLTKVIKNNDLSIELVSYGPKNVTNFFGTGNETNFIKTGRSDIDYYRNRYDLLSADVRLRRSINKKIQVSAGIIGQYYASSASNNTTHFFEKYNISNPDQHIFSKQYYAGIAAGTIVDTRNNGLFSSRGIFWNTELKALNQLNGDRKPNGSIFSEFNIYTPLFNDSNIVIANRIGGGTTVGSPAFYQQMQLGGLRNLRGFHTYRFTGKTMLFHNLDIRCKLFDFTSYLFPGTVGFVGFNDIGRVWVPGEASNKWHDGYGGGIYIIPADLILIQAAVGHSVEGTLPYISIGFTF